MATGFGMGPDQNGNGTTPDDIQRITSAEYIWAGIINGCTVNQTTGMSYQVDGGAAVIRVGEFAKVKVPVFAQTIPTLPAPATGSRTDIVYVKQNFPASDGNNQVVIGVGTSLPANSLELARYQIPAGITSTRQATYLGNPIFTRPVGGQFGTLLQLTDTDTSTHKPGEVITRGVGSFYLWTDSDVEINLSSCISTPGSGVNDYGSVMYTIYIDDKIFKSWERAYNNVWEIKQFTQYAYLPLGRHTIKYTAQTRWVPSGKPGQWQVRHGYAEKFPGDELTVVHSGVATR